MNPDETVILARYVRALCPQQKFDEYTPDAWHDVLGAYPLAEARTAAAAVAGQQPFVSPAEIIAEMRRRRGENASDIHGPGLPAEVPDADPDDVRAYLAALRAQRTRAADGMELKRRPVAELVAGVVESFGEIPKGDVPEEIADVRRAGPLGIECPRCRAAISRPCRTPGGKERMPHPARADVAQGRAVDPEAERCEMERRRQVSARHLERNASDDHDETEAS